MTVAERRAAVPFLLARGVSQRRACALLHLPRSTFHYHARPDRNVDLEQDMQDLAARHPRYGYRRICALLRRRRVVNKKRIHRLWKRGRWQVRKRPRKRRSGDRTGVPIQALFPNHVWT